MTAADWPPGAWPLREPIVRDIDPAARWWRLALIDPYTLQTHLIGVEAVTLDLVIGDHPGALVVPIRPETFAAVAIIEHRAWSLERLPFRVAVRPDLWVLAPCPPAGMQRPWRYGTQPGDHQLPVDRYPDREIVMQLPIKEPPRV